MKSDITNSCTSDKIVCFCGANGQDFQHLIEDCDDAQTHALLDRRRLDLQTRIKRLYLEAWVKGTTSAIDSQFVVAYALDVCAMSNVEGPVAGRKAAELVILSCALENCIYRIHFKAVAA